jgi:hypothetical protein
VSCLEAPPPEKRSASADADADVDADVEAGGATKSGGEKKTAKVTYASTLDEWEQRLDVRPLLSTLIYNICYADSVVLCCLWILNTGYSLKTMLVVCSHATSIYYCPCNGVLSSSHVGWSRIGHYYIRLSVYG